MNSVGPGRPKLIFEDFRNNLLGEKIDKKITFLNSTGTLTVFTITGTVRLCLVPVCEVNVASVAGANIELGVPSDTDGIIASTLASSLAAGEIWIDATPTTKIEPFSSVKDMVISAGENVILTLDNQVDSGAIDFFGFWVPISSDGLVA